MVGVRGAEVFVEVGDGVAVVVGGGVDGSYAEVGQLPPEGEGGVGAFVTGLGADEEAIGAGGNPERKGGGTVGAALQGAFHPPDDVAGRDVQRFSGEDEVG